MSHELKSHTRGQARARRPASDDPNAVEERTAAEWLPDRRDLASLRAAASSCRGCPLWEHATQTVFGEGRSHARLFLIGEQPGDEEDQQGKPFVGPAGKMLDRALAAARIDRKDVYVTNAVKHFGFVYRGKRRLHAKPVYRSVLACRPWLEAELAAVKPQVVLCLGATAAQSLLGSGFSVMKNRGKVLQTPWAKSLVVSYHPSAILRMPDAESRHEAFANFVRDLELCAREAAKANGRG